MYLCVFVCICVYLCVLSNKLVSLIVMKLVYEIYIPFQWRPLYRMIIKNVLLYLSVALECPYLQLIMCIGVAAQEPYKTNKKCNDDQVFNRSSVNSMTNESNE